MNYANKIHTLKQKLFIVTLQTLIAKTTAYYNYVTKKIAKRYLKITCKINNNPIKIQN